MPAVTRAASRRCEAEKPPDTSPPSNPNSLVAGKGVDAFAQALKALSDRSPFDDEEAVARATNLPAVLAKFVTRPFHGRKKHKRSHGESVGGHTGLGFWDSVEDFFRAVTPADVEKLVPPPMPFGDGSVSVDSCFLVPEVGSGFRNENGHGVNAVDLSSASEKVEEKERMEDAEGRSNDSVQPAELINGVGVSGDEALMEDEAANENLSLNWLLGSNERLVVTSERSSRKRKLLGAEGGLDRLLLLPNLGTVAVCDYCCLGDSRVKSNKLLCCDSCKVLVHQKCYGVGAHKGLWLCEWCKKLDKTDKASRQDDQNQSSMVCLLCPKEAGALKPVRTGPCKSPTNARPKFVHLFCSLWTPDVYVEDINLMNLVANKENIHDRHKTLVCDVCKVKHGVCVKCSHGPCRALLHPLCARESKHRIEIWGKFGCDHIELRIFCLKHSAFVDTSNTKVGILKDMKLMSDCDNLVAKILPSPKVIPAKRLPKTRFTCSNQDRFRTELESTTFGPCEIVETETNSLHKFLPGMQGTDCQEEHAMKTGSDIFVNSRQVRRSNRNVSVALRRTLSTEHEVSEHFPRSAVPGQEGNDANVNMKFSNMQSNILDVEERFLSSMPHMDGALDANHTEASALDKTCPRISGCNTDITFPTNLFGKVSGAGSPYIHPFIKKKLIHLLSHVSLNQNKWDRNINSLPNKSILKDITSQRGSSFPFTNSYFKNHRHISESRLMNILNHSPDDEVEAEIIYLQAILLDKDAILRHHYADLTLKVVQKLPEELNLMNNQEWEFAHVNQYLNEVKEVRNGRRDSRHKEAQTSPSTTAAALASSETGFFSNHADTETNSTSQQSSSKVNFCSRSAELYCALLPQSKKFSRLANLKASLDKQGLVFQIPDLSKDNALSCEICMHAETIINRISACSMCKVTVHLDCYRRVRNPITLWKCELCQEMLSERGVSIMPNCGLCGGASGAFRKSRDGDWVHAFCAEWLLGSRFRRGQEKLVEGMRTVPKNKDDCCICLKNVGACLQCSYIDCPVNFHPLCARDAGFYMTVKSAGNGLEHKAYCEKHSIKKLEADNLQYGSEENKNIKQIRVELEKLRFLLERIVKREKLKRDLVLCFHNILASRRDTAAHSIFEQSSFSPSRFSSESDRISITKKSFSGTVQQFDDIIMGSTSAGKRRIKISLKKRKLADRTLMGGKQLEDGGQKLKTRKTICT